MIRSTESPKTARKWKITNRRRFYRSAEKVPHNWLAIKRWKKKKQMAGATGMTNKNHAYSCRWSRPGVIYDSPRRLPRPARQAPKTCTDDWKAGRGEIEITHRERLQLLCSHVVAARAREVGCDGFRCEQTVSASHRRAHWLTVERPAALLTASASGGCLSWTSGSERCATCHRTGARSGSPLTAGWLERRSWKCNECITRLGRFVLLHKRMLPRRRALYSDSFSVQSFGIIIINSWNQPLKEYFVNTLNKIKNFLQTIPFQDENLTVYAK